MSRFLYSITVEDVDTYTRPWSAVLSLNHEPDDGIFEYACHEANYGPINALEAARAVEATSVDSLR